MQQLPTLVNMHIKEETKTTVHNKAKAIKGYMLESLINTFIDEYEYANITKKHTQVMKL